MKNSTLLTKFAFITGAFSLLLLGGYACGGKSSVNVKEVASNMEVGTQIDSLEKDIQRARERDVHVLSPTFFDRAEKSLRTAKEMKEEGGNLKKINAALAKGRAQIQKAENFANVARTSVPKAIEARDDALKAGASMFEKDYGKAQMNFEKMTDEIESNDLKSAMSMENEVAADFRTLELRAIKASSIGPAREIVQQAEKDGAIKMAPQMYANAKEKLRSADNFISKNRYKSKEIREKANEALFAARRLESILNQAKMIRKQSPEKTALTWEKMLHELSQEMNVADMRDQPLKRQWKSVSTSISELRKDRGFLATQLEERKETINTMQAKLEKLGEVEQKLAAEEEFQKRYKKVRSYFNDSEAEVYKQGDKALIRLKAIEFPVGKHVLYPENYPLLTKVQQAIRTFENPSVTVKGHTDSTGTKSLNEQLSERRAEAVMDYLLANQTVNPQRVVAIGYGSDEPIAPNETEKGRALNRRIDVVIDPSP